MRTVICKFRGTKKFRSSFCFSSSLRVREERCKSEILGLRRWPFFLTLTCIKLIWKVIKNKPWNKQIKSSQWPHPREIFWIHTSQWCKYIHFTLSISTLHSASHCFRSFCCITLAIWRQAVEEMNMITLIHFMRLEIKKSLFNHLDNYFYKTNYDFVMTKTEIISFPFGNC